MGGRGRGRPVVYSYTGLIIFFLSGEKNVKSKDKNLHLHKKNKAPKNTGAN